MFYGDFQDCLCVGVCVLDFGVCEVSYVIDQALGMDDIFICRY